MPSASFPRCTQSGSLSTMRSRFWKNKISEVTSVPAFALNAVFGSLTAPNRSALCARYLLTSGLALSMVPLLVIKATTPPGRTLSNVFAKK